jgi:hypothetical protein
MSEDLRFEDGPREQRGGPGTPRAPQGGRRWAVIALVVAVLVAVVIYLAH